MRTKRAIYNTITSTSMQIITILVGFIIPKIIIETYGSSTFGLITSITQFVMLLFFIEMGLRGAIVFELYKPIAEKNSVKINNILTTAKKYYNLTGIYFTILLIAMVIFYPLVIETEGIDWFEVVILILTIGATGVINFFTTSKYKVLLTASQREYLYSFSRIVYVIINATIIYLLVFYNLSISMVYLVSLLANIIQAVMIIYFCRKLYPYINFNGEVNKKYLSKRNDVLIHKISQSVLISAPVVILSLFGTLSEVSVYSIYAMIFVGINMVTTVLSNSLSAGFGQIISQNEKNVLKKAYAQFELFFYLVISYIFSGALILGIPFLEIYTKNFSDETYIDFQILILFIIIGIMNNWKIPQNTIIVAAGHFNQTRHRAIIELCINIPISILLVLIIGLKGVLIGAIIGLIYRSIDLLYARRITGISVNKTLNRLCRIIITILISFSPFIFVIELNPSNFLIWVLYSIIVSIWIVVVIIFINYFFEKQDMKALINRIINLRNR